MKSSYAGSVGGVVSRSASVRDSFSSFLETFEPSEPTPFSPRFCHSRLADLHHSSHLSLEVVDFYSPLASPAESKQCLGADLCVKFFFIGLFPARFSSACFARSVFGLSTNKPSGNGSFPFGVMMSYGFDCDS